MNKQQAKVAKLEAASRELMDLQRTVSAGDYWRHVRSGRTYRVTTLALREADLAPCVVYAQLGDALRINWTRPAKEFLDGRFIRLDMGEEERHGA